MCQIGRRTRIIHWLTHDKAYSFVTIQGTAQICPYKQKEVVAWATKVAERYMGKKSSSLFTILLTVSSRLSPTLA